MNGSIDSWNSKLTIRVTDKALIFSWFTRSNMKALLNMVYTLGHMFLPPVVSTPQVPRKMGSPMHEESVFYKYNIQNSNLLAATAAFWTFSQKFMKKAKKIHFLGFFSISFWDLISWSPFINKNILLLKTSKN